MEIRSINDIQNLVRSQFQNWDQCGYVDVSYHDGLVLFNYSPKAQIEGTWNFFERVSRGLILNAATGEIVARPFDKFFNWGEKPVSGKCVEITEKMDGSLGILYRHRGQYFVATRGSFNSAQAKWATDFLNKNFDLSDLPEEYTLLFEIIYPENRVVVNYGDRKDLVLIGVRNRFTGEDLFFEDFKHIGEKYGFSMPRTYQFDSIDEILKLAQQLDYNFEGWVLRFDNGTRVKIKGKGYLEIHRLVFNLNFRRVTELWFTGKLNEYLEAIPDEFLAEVRTWVASLEDAVKTAETEVLDVINSMPRFDTRKELAQWLRQHHPSLMSLVLNVLDGKDVTHQIIKVKFDVQLKHLIKERESNQNTRVLPTTATIGA